MKSQVVTVFILFIVIVSTGTASAPPADTLVFRSALIIKAPPGFADNIARTDPIEAAIVAGAWRTPLQNDSLRYSDSVSSRWESVHTDSTGWFEHPSLGGGYVHIAFDLPADTTMLLAAMGNSMVYVNGVPRSGNPYSGKDRYEPWEPRFDYSLLPVRLKGGTNELLFHCSRGRFKAQLIRLRAPIFINANDCTTPDLVSGRPFNGDAAIVIVNASPLPMKGWTLECLVGGNPAASSAVPLIHPFSLRKVRFAVRTSGRTSPGPIPARLTLRRSGSGLHGVVYEGDTMTIRLRVVNSRDARKETFVSAIDGSVQYFAVTPSSSGRKPAALFLSLHGAGVEAINQAQAYAPKSWGIIVAPTNRRPYGFNWEDWGRWDALEVLRMARMRFPVDESRVYLTGHSMGGHGTYHIGSLFPDQFAAIGPSAGWISFWTYRVRDRIDAGSAMRQMLMRATLPSETYTMSVNYKRLGMYILHGSADDNVLPDQSRMIMKHLTGFHKDIIYHEQQGAGHWWDLSDAPGADCVDWPPLFDFFARHARPMSERIRRVEFATPGPGISSRCDWLTVEAQAEQLRLSTVDLQFDPDVNRVLGSTVNVARMTIDPLPLGTTGPFTCTIDGQTLADLSPASDGRIWLTRTAGNWQSGSPPSPDMKNPLRSGTFKDVFRNRVLFVYGTAGTEDENAWAFHKALFDAERFWYQGNGSIDIVPDSDFDPRAEPDRNIVLYGSATTNRAWSSLLGKSPVQVGEHVVTAGTRTMAGTDLACLVIRPRPGSSTACVGAVGGTGITGMRLTDRMPYLLPGVAFPDLLIARPAMLNEGEDGLEGAGFFGLDWKMDSGEFVWK